LRAIVGSLGESARPFVFPVHPRTRHALDEHRIELPANVQAIAPLGYLEMLALIASGDAVVTDSGGLQKEAYWLRVPCVTVRPSTEWVDTVAAGANTLVEPEQLAGALEEARYPADAPQLYGDGHAAERVAAALYP
jgi:UDP-GlcNAc3NAcA epimerase